MYPPDKSYALSGLNSAEAPLHACCSGCGINKKNLLQPYNCRKYL